MKIQLIQFSDIHFKEKGNTILEKKEQLINAIRNEVLVENETILIITGDSAFLAIIPSIALILLILSFVFVSNGLKDLMGLEYDQSQRGSV